MVATGRALRAPVPREAREHLVRAHPVREGTRGVEANSRGGAAGRRMTTRARRRRGGRPPRGLVRHEPEAPRASSDPELGPDASDARGADLTRERPRRRRAAAHPTVPTNQQGEKFCCVRRARIGAARIGRVTSHGFCASMGKQSHHSRFEIRRAWPRVFPVGRIQAAFFYAAILDPRSTGRSSRRESHSKPILCQLADDERPGNPVLAFAGSPKGSRWRTRVGITTRTLASTSPPSRVRPRSSVKGLGKTLPRRRDRIATRSSGGRAAFASSRSLRRTRPRLPILAGW